MPSILPLTPENTEKAATALRAGELVAFPTETVYGLGADATNDKAVAKIYEAKNRPSFNPLIVHLPDVDGVRRLAEFSPLADRLAAKFWPGAISFVLPRKPGCPLSKLVSAGLPTFAARVPAKKSARDLLRAAGIPVAGPSANRSGRISPTQAAHVASDLGDRVSIILDDGPCAVGVESTVLDVTGGTPTILRPGGVTQEDIEATLGQPIAVASSNEDSPKSPGMLLSHYAPRLPVRLNATGPNDGEAYLGFGGSTGAEMNLSVRGDLTEAAANLFAFLHELDEPRWSGIAVAAIPEVGLGRAINDRLRRAAAPRG
ncbi:MAG: L-threonylcarbamoyladenylate synthase [Rhodospirillaceae bacterium]|nr:L-threonylcarbamoyladenylate synthase [Rhodospirillaceae bacterium]MDD9916825.1 L-threonylcarbamoyladenylate synthase [Rhodospirillaceae bacterium]